MKTIACILIVAISFNLSASNKKLLSKKAKVKTYKKSRDLTDVKYHKKVFRDKLKKQRLC